jgi:CRISPR-associated protein Cas5d
MIVKCWADFGCFTRADTRTQPVSYPIIPPTAARGLLRSVHWKPQIRWTIDRIDVLNPIQFMDMKVRGRKDGHGEHTLIQMLVLEEPAFQLHVGVVPTEEADADPAHLRGKHFNMLERRLERGQYYRPPYMGVRDFTAHVALVEDGKAEAPIDETRPVPNLPLDLGWYKENNQWKTDPEWFDGVIEQGTLDVPTPEDLTTAPTS